MNIIQIQYLNFGTNDIKKTVIHIKFDKNDELLNNTEHQMIIIEIIRKYHTKIHEDYINLHYQEKTSKIEWVSAYV